MTKHLFEAEERERAKEGKEELEISPRDLIYGQFATPFFSLFRRRRRRRPLLFLWERLNRGNLREGHMVDQRGSMHRDGNTYVF